MRRKMIWKSVVIFLSVGFLVATAEVEDGEKFCNLKDTIHPLEIWNYWAGYWCYFYTNTYRLSFQYSSRLSTVQIGDKNYKVPVALTLDNSTTFTYDYTNDFTRTNLRHSFKTEHFFQMWLDCGQEAFDCCNDTMTNENIVATDGYCPAIWDAWTCFTPAKANTIQKQTCSKQAYSTDSDVCELESQKECFADGTWNNKTDYTTCAMAPVLRNRHTFNVIILAAASVLAFPAVLIFFSLRSFRQNLRYILHRNLILVIVVRNLLSIMTKEIIILDALKSGGSSNKVLEESLPWCKILAFFENAAKNGMYACMLADGFYLHKLIVRAFADDPSSIFIYATVGALSFGPSLIWAIARASREAGDCWVVDETGDQWITDGFRIAILAINFLLLCDIIRVMVTKLRRGGISQQTKSTLKATVLLIPLFGLHIVIITNRNMFPSKTCQQADIYYYVSYLIEGLQGVMVAILFCYLNGEVWKELKNVFRKFTLYLESRHDIKLATKNRRRTTAATFVDPF